MSACTTIESALSRLESIFVAAGVGQDIDHDPLAMRETPMLDALEAPARPVTVKAVVTKKAPKSVTKKRRRMRKKVESPLTLEMRPYVQHAAKIHDMPCSVHTFYQTLIGLGAPRIGAQGLNGVLRRAGVIINRKDGVSHVVGVCNG